MFDPEVKAYLDALNDGFPAVEEFDPLEVRGIIESRRAPVENVDDVARTRDVSIPVEGAAIDARVYHPHDQGDRAPLICFFHGGGFVFCDLETHDALCRELARDTSAVVVSVAYRRAPEHRAPTAANDAEAALRWAAEHAEELGADADRLALAGDSSGGNLAAVVALRAGRDGPPAVALQLLLYPVLDPACDTPSYEQFATGYYNTRAAMRWYWRHYLPDDPADVDESLIAPGRAELGGAPPTVLAIAGHDPLRDEGRRYGQRLRGAGVPLVQLEYPGLFHGFVTMFGMEASKAARRQIWREAREQLARATAMAGEVR